MTEIVLIIALTIAIVMDAIRIMQYHHMRKATDRILEKGVARKIDSLWRAWYESNREYSIGEYVTKHWNDEED